jgi:hypothetical protein
MKTKLGGFLVEHEINRIKRNTKAETFIFNMVKGFGFFVQTYNNDMKN